jgi:quercetin dioxygenase-like cupin family protein
VEILERKGRRALVKVACEELVVMEVELESGGAGPHFHRQHVDSFYVLAGELELTVEGERLQVGPGMLVAVPPGVVHSFDHDGPERARFLNIHAPGMRFDEYMRRMDAGEEFDHTEYDAWAVEQTGLKHHAG